MCHAWCRESSGQGAGGRTRHQALFAASRHWLVNVIFNKGLAGAPPAAIQAARNTAMNPDLLDTFLWSLSHPTARRPSPGSRHRTSPLPAPAAPASKLPWPPCALSHPTPAPVSMSATISSRIGRRRFEAQTILASSRSNGATTLTDSFSSTTASGARP